MVRFLMWTEREANERLGVDHSMIVRYENGVSLPPPDRLIALADLAAAIGEQIASNGER